MKTKFTKIIALAVSIISIAAFATPVFAEACEDICHCEGVSEEVQKAAGCKPGTPKLADSIQSIINAIILVLGTVAVVFIVMGGVQYMTSAGDAGKIKKAKDTILYACIGLAVCALAFAIANFTISAINSSGCNPGEIYDSTTKTCKKAE